MKPTRYVYIQGHKHCSMLLYFKWVKVKLCLNSYPSWSLFVIYIYMYISAQHPLNNLVSGCHKVITQHPLNNLVSGCHKVITQHPLNNLVRWCHKAITQHPLNNLVSGCHKHCSMLLYFKWVKVKLCLNSYPSWSLFVIYIYMYISALKFCCKGRFYIYIYIYIYTGFQSRLSCYYFEWQLDYFWITEIQHHMVVSKDYCGTVIWDSVNRSKPEQQKCTNWLFELDVD